jgi:hypothetical protein
MVGTAYEAAMRASTSVAAGAAAAAAVGVVVVVVVVLRLVLLVVPQWSVEERQVGKPVCWGPGALECYVDGSVRLTNQVSAAAFENILVSSECRSRFSCMLWPCCSQQRVVCCTSLGHPAQVAAP